MILYRITAIGIAVLPPLSPHHWYATVRCCQVPEQRVDRLGDENQAGKGGAKKKTQPDHTRPSINSCRRFGRGSGGRRRGRRRIGEGSGSTPKTLFKSGTACQQSDRRRVLVPHGRAAAVVRQASRHAGGLVLPTEVVQPGVRVLG